MAQSGFTPISNYYSATTTNVPTAGNLVAGELALNTADGKLFYKDSGGVVQTLATKSTTAGTFASITDTGLTSGRITYATTGGLLTDSANLTFSGGNLVKPASSTFLAQVAGNVSNVTGDGTLYTIIYNTEILDYNANYNPSTGVFTAPVTGAYQFNVLAYLYALTTAVTTVEFTLVTSNRSYQFIVGSWFNGYAQFPVGSIVADMDAADTAYVTVKVSGTTKTISVGQASSFFSGFLIG